MDLITLVTTESFEDIASPIIEICEKVLPVLLTVVGAIGSIWCIVLGVQLAKASEPQEHEKAKKGLKNAVIGFVLIFVLLIALRVGLAVFKDWYTNYDWPTY